MKIFTATKGGKWHILEFESSFGGGDPVYHGYNAGHAANSKYAETKEYEPADKKRLCKSCERMYYKAKNKAV